MVLIPDVPVRSSITIITWTDRLRVPCSLANITVNFIPLLEVTWKGRELMKQTVEVLTSRRRKAVQLAERTDEYTLLPYSFVRD